MPDDENLLHENTVFVNEEKSKDPSLYSYIIQRPNQSVLGVPVKLNLYNYGNPDFEETFEEWSLIYPKRTKRLTQVFSEKQARLIYKNNVGMNNWILKKGQAPVIFNEIKAAKTADSFRKFYFANGFFNAQVDFETELIKEKQLDVNYKIVTNNQYFIDTVSTEISSPVLDSIYHKALNKSHLKPWQPIVFENFENEQKRLSKLFRNSGIYHFNPNVIGYWMDSTNTSFKKDVLLKIPDRVVEKNDSSYLVPYKIQKLKNIKVYTDFSISNRNAIQKDSATYNGITYYATDKLEYNPKHLSRTMFLNPGEVYKDENQALTRSHIRRLQNFKSTIDINYTEVDDENLNADIYLSPLKKYAFTVNLDGTTSNSKPFGILGKFSFIDKNLFKGAETLELSFQGSFLNASESSSTSGGFFNAWEVISKASLTIPRIFFPINTDKLIPKHMSPMSNIDISTGFQKNIGLDRQTITAGLGYSWRTSKRIGHKVELFNFQYIENKNVENYFNIYDSEYQKLNEVSENLYDEPLEQDYDEVLLFMDEVLDPDNGYEESNPIDYDVVTDVDERYNILIEDVFVPVVSYAINFNTKENLNDQDFYFITARIVGAGNVATFFSQDENENGQKQFFGVPIAQYLKTEFEFKKYWDLSQENILVFRTFLGAAFPYGNSDNIPFSRSYSAGGSNDIRAWRTYDLGPGGVVNNLEFNVGTFKMVTNFEYRFKVLDKIYSALFVDIGNIWDITNSNLVSPLGKFTSLESLKNSAIGSGFGIRYDFSFLVFRFDIGFKTYEPYLINQNKWFTNYNFGNAVYNIGINYPF